MTVIIPIIIIIITDYYRYYFIHNSLKLLRIFYDILNCVVSKDFS